ncbi:hypothetical protein WMF18_22255 [Sorangium sp. So ce315]|uniref:hypothetical protein n=1 Tax=Sorangium sp. So ce315 TaxID=3133299 RepID=UPI003F5FE3C2
MRLGGHGDVRRRGRERAAYRRSAPLPDGFERCAAAFDLVNLVGLLDGVEPGARRANDVVARILATLEDDRS